MSYGQEGYGEDEYGGAPPSNDPVEVPEEVTLAEALTASLGVGDSISEVVTISEEVTASLVQAVSVSETIVISEIVSTGTLQVGNLGGATIYASFPGDLHFDQITNLSKYFLAPFVGSHAAPLAIHSVSPVFDVYGTGDTGAVVPEGSSGSFDLADGCSNVFEFTGALDSSNLGDFIQIDAGSTAGLYQILAVLSDGPNARVRLDQKLPILGDDGGVFTTTSVSLVEVTDLVDGEVTSSSKLVFQVDHPSVTADTPLLQLYRLEKAARVSDDTLSVFNLPVGYVPENEGEVVPAGSFNLSTVVFLDYRTFQIDNPGQPLLKGTSSDLDSLVDSLGVVFKADPQVSWSLISGVKAASISTSKITDNENYIFRLSGVFSKYPKNPFDTGAIVFQTSAVPHPRVDTVTIDQDEGVITVQYTEAMQQDNGNLTNPGDYTITGPTDARVRRVVPLGDRTVALETQGLSDGEYELTVSINTPKDLAGNPLDPAFNAAVFNSFAPLRSRSIFTDKGPIAKPPLTLQTGTLATVDNFETLTLPGATLTNSAIGMRVTLTGSTYNDDTYKISSVLSATKVKVQARLQHPDSGTIAWEVFNPRHGMIADDPSDVVVRINGTPVATEAVVGLRGQIILQSEPLTDDDIQVDYNWVLNPRVEIRRLNSKEFRLNSWNRNTRSTTETGHQYRYNNVLIKPGNFDPEDMQASMPAPQLRDLKYRAYERAYTATLNDPTKLLLNTPQHKVAYPPAQRRLSEVARFYEATTLPENDPTAPWSRKGAGTAVSFTGNLTVTDDSTEQGIFWTQDIDLSFEHAFSAAWRFAVNSFTVSEGVWSGVAAGYSDEIRAFVVGYLDVSGVKKIGFLKADSEDRFDSETSWIGGLDGDGVSTGTPANFDWSVVHSYRLFTDQDGVVSLYVDGDIVPTLRIAAAEAPFLEEINAPFDEIQGVFFGSLSGPATNVSTWDFYRYLIQPLNALQTAPASFVSYEGNVIPEVDSSPWTPLGFHGTSTVISSNLLLDSTSASDSGPGLIGGDFHGYVKLEPLLSPSSQYAIDVNTQLLTHTSGPDPYALMVAVDDGTHLAQLAFFSDTPAPKISYGGNTLPPAFSPTPWTALGGQPGTMRGRILNIADASAVDGLVYYVEDTAPVSSDDRVVATGFDYIAEARLRVNSYTADSNGFAGAFVQVYDSSRSLGFLLMELSGTKYVALQSEGLDLGPTARWSFNWGDGDFHTYRIRKSTGGNLVSVFADGVFLGSTAYSNFTIPAADPQGVVSFGSATVASTQALSNVDWEYCNAWRIVPTGHRYVGLWKGYDGDSLTGYHLPLKLQGKNAIVAGNALGDTLVDFVASNVLTGDSLIVDNGPNKGVYEVLTVAANNLTLSPVWPLQPSQVDYRIAKQTDWSVAMKYRLNRDASGTLAVLIGTDTSAAILVNYNSTDLPLSSEGLISTVSNGLGAIAFGSFSSTELAQSRWDYVRYGITRNLVDQRIVPPHQVLNQWNVMESPERLFTVVPHTRTGFKSSSTGNTPQTAPDFLSRTDVPAYTQLNEGTPLVPSTQTFEVRGPFPTQSFISGLNSPTDVLSGSGGFVLNNANRRYSIVVPDDVLYSSLKVTATSVGETSLLAPFDDELGPQYGTLQYTNETCLEYTGDVLPENDTAGTLWSRNSVDPSHTLASVSGGILTYGTDGTGTRTVYLNNTPLPDAIGLQTEARFRLRLQSDATGGTGDSQVRFGLSAPGMTIGLGFVTSPTGERHVLAFDSLSGTILGYSTFDYLDGNYHTYRIVRTPSARTVEIFIDN